MYSFTMEYCACTSNGNAKGKMSDLNTMVRPTVLHCSDDGGRIRLKAKSPGGEPC